jgi:hypothetical protein
MRHFATRLLVSAALGTSALTAFSAPPASAGHEVRAVLTAKADRPQLRIGSYNFMAGRPLRKFIRAMKRFKPYVDVAGLQEMGMTSRSKWLLKDPSWGYYRPPALQQNPIIWRRSAFDFVSAKGMKIADKRNLGTEHGAGSESKGNTYATVVHLRDIANGQQISFMNVHLVHGAIQRTDPYPGRPRTYRLYLAQVKGLIAAIKTERANPANTGGVYVTGDFNISYRPDAHDKKKNLPYASMRRIDMHSLWAHSWVLSRNRGSHGTCLYDEVWNTGRPVSAKILRTIKGSDHYPVVATYNLPTAEPNYAPASGEAGFVQQSVEGAEYYNQSFMRFPITGSLDVGWVEVQQVPDDGSDVAQMGTDFVIDDSSLQPGSDHILVRAIADGNHHEPRLEHFTLQLVPYGGATIPNGEDTVQGFINDSDKK